jgi:hypothetical protein
MSISLRQAEHFELTLGHMFDVLTTLDETVRQLKLRGNASVASRGDLEYLQQQLGSIWGHLNTIRNYELPAIAKAGGSDDHANGDAQECADSAAQVSAR